MSKRVKLVWLALIALVLLTVFSLFVVGRVQQARAMQTLENATAHIAPLQELEDRDALRQQAVCKPDTGHATRCPALFYPIGKQACLEIQARLGSQKEQCGFITQRSYEGRAIELRFGRAYERDDGRLYAVVILNEPTGFSWFRY